MNRWDHVRSPNGLRTWNENRKGQKILIKACPPVNLTGIYDKIRSVRTFDVFVWLFIVLFICCHQDQLMAEQLLEVATMLYLLTY